MGNWKRYYNNKANRCKILLSPTQYIVVVTIVMKKRTSWKITVKKISDLPRRSIYILYKNLKGRQIFKSPNRILLMIDWPFFFFVTPIMPTSIKNSIICYFNHTLLPHRKNMKKTTDDRPDALNKCVSRK